jgi:hypothetical protein
VGGSSNRFSKIWWLFLVPATYFSARYIFGFYDHNESMYLMSAWRLTQGADLYADFAFLQAPIYPMVLAPLVLAFGGSLSLLMIGKGFALLLWLACVVLLVGEGKKRGLPLYLSLALSLSFMMAYPQLRSFAEASNYGLPVLFFLLAAFRAERYLRGDESPGLAFQTGLFLGLAVATKSYYAIWGIPAVFVFAHSPKGKRLYPLLLGGLLGSFPLWFSLVLHGPETWFGNVEFHRITTDWKQEFGAPQLSLASRLEFMADWILRWDNLPTVLLCLYVLIAQALKKNWGGLAFRFLVLALPAAMVVSMQPLFTQYLPLLSAAVFVVVVVDFAKINLNSNVQLGIGALLLGSMLLQPKPLWWVWKTSRPVTTIQINPQFSPDSALSLSPLIAHELGMPGPAELTCGPFLVRIADRIKESKRNNLGVWTLQEMETMILTQRFPVVVTGHEPLHEAGIVERLQQANYRATDGPLFTKIWRRADLPQ